MALDELAKLTRDGRARMRDSSKFCVCESNIEEAADGFPVDSVLAVTLLAFWPLARRARNC